MTPIDEWLSRQPTWVLLALVLVAVPFLWAAALADRYLPRHPTYRPYGPHRRHR